MQHNVLSGSRASNLNKFHQAVQYSKTSNKLEGVHLMTVDMVGFLLSSGENIAVYVYPVYVKVKDRVPSKELRERLGIDDIILILQQNRL